MRKKEKILIFILLSFLGFIANVYLSEMLNTLLLGNDVDIDNLKFFSGLKSLFIDEDKRKLFLLLECIKYLGIVFLGCILFLVVVKKITKAKQYTIFFCCAILQ